MAFPIQTVSIAEEVRSRFLRYAMSVIRGRALPDVRDGLKPVQRRILYTMYHDLHLYARRPAREVRQDRRRRDGQLPPARRRGHLRGPGPHGPGLGACGVPLVHGQGNFGSVDGDPPAAYRYTEAKLTPVAEPPDARARQETVDMRPNYDGTTRRAGRPAGPVPEPAGQRHVRASPSAWRPTSRRTTSARCCEACVLLIDNPDATTAKLMEQGQGAGLPARRQDRHRPGDAAQDLRGGHRHASRCRPSGRSRTSASGRSRSSSRRSPTAWTRAKLENDIGAHHRGAQAAAAHSA